MLRIEITILSTVLVTAATPALAGPQEHVDVWIQWANDRIVTGSVTEGDPFGTPVAGVERVFGADFFDFGGQLVSDEPGLQSFDGTFAPFTSLQVNITDAVTLWDGNGFTATDAVITLDFGPQSVTSGDGFVEGFAFGTDDEGGFHGHFDVLLTGDGGGDPGIGIYLMPLTLSLDQLAPSGLPGESDTFWWVFNHGLSEQEHDAAIDWVRGNLVPAPATALLPVIGLLATGRRRRRPLRRDGGR